LASSLCSLEALIDYKKQGVHDNGEITMVVLFDHEEIGSKSAQGADSNLLVEACDRIFYNFQPNGSKEQYYTSLRKSYFISADMAHAVHPNYADKHHA